jgi:hypothetical protein
MIVHGDNLHALKAFRKDRDSGRLPVLDPDLLD